MVAAVLHGPGEIRLEDVAEPQTVPTTGTLREKNLGGLAAPPRP